MKRNKFLRVMLGAGGLFSMPFRTAANSFLKLLPGKGFKVDAGKDRKNMALSLLEGDTFYCKVSTTDSNGAMYAFESTREKKGGPPLHYHFEQDEWWYILEGEFLFQVGDEQFTARAGDSAFGPREVPHTFSKINDGPAKMLIVFQPAGRMEYHFEMVSKGAFGKMNEDEKDKFRTGNGFKVVGPALVYDKSR